MKKKSSTAVSEKVLGGAIFPEWSDLSWLQPTLRSLLPKLIHKRTLPHFLLLSSSSLLRAELVAEKIALEWVQSPSKKIEEHPDIISLRPQGKSGVYTVENIKGVLESLSMNSLYGMGRAVIIQKGDGATISAANALLKVLEEPPSDTIFLMTTENLEQVLPTILSRSQILRIPGDRVSEQERLYQDIPSLQITLEEAHGDLFRLPDLRPDYSALYRSAEKYAAALELIQKALLESSRDELSDKDEVESLSSIAFVTGAQIVLHEIEERWKKNLLHRSYELKLPSGRDRYPDDTLLAFYNAYRAVVLQMPTEELFVELLASIFGYAQSKETLCL